MSDHAEDLFDVFDDSDEETEGAPEITGVPALFLRKLRERDATWRELGIDYSDVFTAWADGRIWVVFSLLDQEANIVIGSVRVDVTDTEWKAAWVGSGDAHEFEESSPIDPISRAIDDPDRDTDAAISWLTTQLHSPISRYVWVREGRVVAQLWQIDDTEQPLAAAGTPPEDASLGTADRVVRIR